MTSTAELVESVRFSPGSDALEQVLAASRSRCFLDFRSGSGRGVIAADDLRRACLSSGDADPFGIRIANARIVGVLDLRAANVAVPLHFVGCTFANAPRLEGAELHELFITNGRHGGAVPAEVLPTSELPGLLANGVRIRRDMQLSGTLVTGTHASSASLTRTSAIWLTEAQIGGRLLAVGTHIRATGDRAMQCDRTKVAGDIRLIHGFSSNAEIRFLAMQLAGSLDLTASSILSDNGRALDLSEATIGGSLFLLDDPDLDSTPTVTGRIEMGNATINGQFLIRNAALSAPPAGAGRHDYNPEEVSSSTFLVAPRLTVHGELAIEGQTTINGGLNLRGADLKGGFRTDGAVIHNAAETALDLSQSVLGASLTMQRTNIRGTLSLANAHIAGLVDLRDATLDEPWHRRCLIGISVNVAGDVILRNMSAHGGSVNLRNATIGGAVDAEAALLANAGDKTLSLSQAHILGNVRLCKGFTSTGLVVLNRATIDGRLRCDGATLTWQEAEQKRRAGSEPNERGAAIEAISAVVRSGIGLGWNIRGAVDLTDARTSYLADNAASDWPDQSYLSGFVYERFAPLSMTDGRGLWDASVRSRWLARMQPDDPQPWEQAARVLHNSGDRAGAEQILIAQRRSARRRRVGSQNRRHRRIFDVFQDLTTGYGHRPQRALLVLLMLIGIVALALSVPAMRATMRAADPGAVVIADSRTAPSSGVGPCGSGRVRCLNPILYAVDTVVPIIDLGQRNTWYPSQGPAGMFMTWLLSICTIMGWVASTVFALSFARLGRSAL